MFVTSGQFSCFFGAISFGGVFGVLYSLIKGIKRLIKQEKISIIIGGALEIIYFIFMSVCFVKYRYYYQYPSIRVYMLLGVILGLVAYAKSFHLLLAKLGFLVYNRINKFILTKKVKLNDGKKVQKSNRRKHGRRGIVGGDTAIGNAFSNNKHQR